MRIQHNIMAMNAYRNYNTNTSALSKNLEKLSSGYKINRAGDDAAGLAISEKMRAQITGLEGAQSNAKDGISLVQTAEGALTEVHDMLNRMYELAEQSANGTYENEVDRMQLQKEVSNLTAEIDRISKASNFNGIKLLDGSLAEAEVDVTAATFNGATKAVATVDATPAATTLSTIAEATSSTATYTYTVEYSDGQGNIKKASVEYTGVTTANGNAAAIKDALAKNSELSSVFDISVTDDDITFTAKEAGTNGAKVISATTTDAGKSAGTAATADGADAYVQVTEGAQTINAGDSITINGQTYEFVKDASTDPAIDGAIAVQVGAAAADSLANLNKALESVGIKAEANGNDLKLSSIKDGTGLSLQIGDTGDDFNQLTVSVKACDSTSIGVANVDISTQEGAQAALATIKNAINYVSDVRGGLGAIQNRLDHTINNLSVMQENIQDAESSIRDTDIADEMMDYTKNNILIQSAQAMLAQANQVPQGVLQLLQ